MTKTKQMLTAISIFLLGVVSISVYAQWGTEIHSCSDVSSMSASSMKNVLNDACNNNLPFAAVLTGTVGTGDGTGANFKYNKFTVQQLVTSSLGTFLISTDINSCSDVNNLYSDSTKTVLQNACSNGDLVNDRVDALENVDAAFNAAPGGGLVWPTGG